MNDVLVLLSCNEDGNLENHTHSLVFVVRDIHLSGLPLQAFSLGTVCEKKNQEKGSTATQGNDTRNGGMVVTTSGGGPTSDVETGGKSGGCGGCCFLVGGADGCGGGCGGGGGGCGGGCGGGGS
ncbi:loricrin-like [Pistacia vera]|uniref:loricrin-like n=1 Tax=Pistacia vera TaxID=55513 RepID=UPI001263AFF8|nr:loricrin-like [Pistacia vera]